MGLRIRLHLEPRRHRIDGGIVKEWHPDQTVKITYDPEAKAFYIKLHCEMNITKVPLWTETLQDINEGPLINVDHRGDTITGIEIVL